MLDFQNIIINKGNPSFQWKSSNQKYFQKMNIYYEILVMFFARALLLFFKQRSKIFCIWSPVDLYHLNCQYFLIHNETAQSSIYKYFSIKLTTVNCSGVSNYKHSHGILVHFENRCWANSMMELIAVDTVMI